MNKFVCFDIGNVLLAVDWNPLHTYFEASPFDVDETSVLEFLQHNQKQCDLGLTTIREEICHYFHIKTAHAALDGSGKAWLDCIVPNPKMLALLSSLQKEGWKIALVSNIGYEHKAKVEIIPAFQGCVKFFSCDVGARKPTALYYKTFLDLHPDFIGAPYIDDLQENLDAGKAFGLKPIKFELPQVGSLVKTDLLKAEIEKLAK